MRIYTEIDKLTEAQAGKRYGTKCMTRKEIGGVRDREKSNDTVWGSEGNVNPLSGFEFNFRCQKIFFNIYVVVCRRRRFARIQWNNKIIICVCMCNQTTIQTTTATASPSSSISGGLGWRESTQCQAQVVCSVHRCRRLFEWLLVIFFLLIFFFLFGSSTILSGSTYDSTKN